MAIKRRNASKVKAFVEGAEEDKPALLKPNAKRDFCSIRVPFNRFEYNTLDKAAATVGRTKLNYIRWSIIQMAKEIGKK